MLEVQQEIICQIQMRDIQCVPNPYECIINHPTGNRDIGTSDTQLIQSTKKASLTQNTKKYHQSLCGSIKPSSKEGHKKVKSKLIKSTNLKGILLPNI